MKITKKNIIDASIDLFAAYGVQNVSVEKIAEKLNVTRGNIYHHFKGGKMEIAYNIIRIFDEMIQYNTPSIDECMDINCDARNVLSKLFFRVRRKDSEKCRKINRIIFSDQHYVDSIRRYMLDEIIKKREENLIQCFNILIQKGEVKPFNVTAAARILNRIYIAYAMEDSHYGPFKSNEMPIKLTDLQNDCMLIVQRIINGNFPY